jgi:hypothetical protein
VICTLELTEEEMLFLLRLRAGEFLVPPPEETGQVKGNETPDSVSMPESVPVEPPPLTGNVQPPPLPPKQQRNRAKASGAEAPVNSTPLAPSPPPPPEALDEPAMRSLLSKVGAVHPLKVKAITNILENCGGARRLSECDPATWPTIAEAALAALKEHSA